MRHALLGLLGLLLAAGCGGRQSGVSTPTEPAVSGWPAGTVLQISGGDTGAPVAATTMFWQGGAMVPYAGQAVENGVSVEITAPGYLKRETMVRTGETRLVLWPDSAFLPASYTKELVYTDEGKVYPLVRPVVASITVSPSDIIRSDAAAVDAHRRAISELNDALLGRLTLGFDAGSPVQVTTEIDATATACVEGYAASMSMGYSGRQVTSARIVFCSARWSRSLFLVTHQLGHVLGLQHSPNAQDVMAAGSGRTSFSPRERLTLSLMFQRGPGNTFPDNDRQVVLASARGTMVMVD